MKKLRIFEMKENEIDRNGNPCQISTNVRAARDLYEYRKSVCEKNGCKNHYEIVQIKFTGSDDKCAYYGVLDIAKNEIV